MQLVRGLKPRAAGGPAAQAQQQQRPSLARRNRSAACAVRASHSNEAGDATTTTTPSSSRRRALLGGLTAGLAAGAALQLGAPRSSQAEPFLSSTGGKGILAAEEEKLYNLQVEVEGEVCVHVAAALAGRGCGHVARLRLVVADARRPRQLLLSLAIIVP
jgi:hypothetical protein